MSGSQDVYYYGRSVDWMHTTILAVSILKRSSLRHLIKSSGNWKVIMKAVFNHTRLFTTTISLLPHEACPEWFSCGEFQPIAYQAPAFDSDLKERQAFPHTRAAGFPTTCAVSGNPPTVYRFLPIHAIEFVKRCRR
jgi:hypothetical protein